jgi:DNA adenine methylase
VQTTPYSRELFDEYTEKLQQDPPDDLVERAGMFWFTQSTAFAGCGVVNSNSPQFGVACRARNGRSPKTDVTKNSADNIYEVCERFRTVQIEHLDFQTVLEKYDSPETIFYCDPPYVDVGDDYYQTEEGGFDHERFVEVLQQTDGKWLVSYDHQIPNGLEDYTVIDRRKKTNISDSKEQKTESLIMNYNPNGVDMFKSKQQQGLEAYND